MVVGWKRIVFESITVTGLSFLGGDHVISEGSFFGVRNVGPFVLVAHEIEV